MPFSWNSLPKPFFILAPMEDVTDCAFREMFARHGKPDLLFTEFVSTEGLMHEEGRKRLSIDLQYTELQRPIIGQIWGADPEKFERVAEYLVELGFDGIDINMGCPQPKEIQSGSCAALIRTPKLAQEIIRATKRGAGNLPVSVKTRIGYSKPSEMAEWVKYVLETEPAALTLHGRTKQEMSKVPAHWDKIAEAVALRDESQSPTVIVGNGDVISRQDGLRRASESRVDGVMIARGAFGNPWLFRADGYEPPVAERLTVMLEHAFLFEEMYSGIKSFSVMRKHFKAYASGFPGASELRAILMQTETAKDTKKAVESFLSSKAIF